MREHDLDEEVAARGVPAKIPVGTAAGARVELAGQAHVDLPASGIRLPGG
jgi:hypothetical protein